jgi:DNA polymerase (family 10)
MSGAELEELPGIGKNISRKIGEIEQTGTFGELEELKQEIPAPLIELLSIEGVGPKTVHTLWNRLSIQNIVDLERAARGHRIRTIRGFGEKKEAAFAFAPCLPFLPLPLVCLSEMTITPSSAPLLAASPASS